MMKRRDFLKVAGGGAVGGVALAGLFDDWVSGSEVKAADIRDLFESEDAEVLALTQRVFDKCILSSSKFGELL